MNASTAATSRAVPRHATGNARGRYGPVLAADQPTNPPGRATQQTHGFQFVPATYWPVVRASKSSRPVSRRAFRATNVISRCFVRSVRVAAPA